MKQSNKNKLQNVSNIRLKNSVLRLCINRQSVSQSDIQTVCQFIELNNKTDSQIKDFYLIMSVLMSENIDLNKLYDSYCHYKEFRQIKTDILNSQSFYETLDKINSQYYIQSLIDSKSKYLTYLNQNLDYIYNSDFIKTDFDILQSLLQTYFKLNKSNKNSKSELHKFIRIYDLFKLLDKIYSHKMFNKQIDINLTNCKETTFKEFVSNNLNLICIRIDTDLFKSNKYKFRQLNYVTVKITEYDTEYNYIILKKSDLLDINIRYSYDFNNYLSYLLDSHKSFYTVFNDSKLKNKVFNSDTDIKRQSIRFNHKIKKMIKTDSLKKETEFNYTNSEYYTFKDLVSDNTDILSLNSVEFDLNKYLCQLDIDLISKDNNTDYNRLLNSEFDFINNLVNNLYDRQSELNSELNSDFKDLINLSNIEFSLNISYVIYCQTVINFNDSLLNKMSIKETELNLIKSDIKTLNFVLDCFNNSFKQSETLQLYDTNINFETMNKHNSIFKTNETDFLKVSYKTTYYTDKKTITEFYTTE